jgi:hypothetical protein
MEHPWILASMQILEPMPHGYQEILHNDLKRSPVMPGYRAKTALSLSLSLS